MRLLFSIILLLFPFRIFSQTCGPLEWERNYGGSLDDIGYSISATSDGGYFFAGCTGSIDSDVVCLVNCEVDDRHGNNCDYWYVKTDGYGNIQWCYNPGGTGSDVARASFETPDGGYVVGGGTDSYDVDVWGNHGTFTFDFWIIKLNNLGDTLWTRCYGGSGFEDFGSGTNAPGGGMIFCGGTGSNDFDVSGNHGSHDFWLLKTDAVGNIQWAKCYGGSGYDNAFSVTPTFDGGYILVGFTDSDDGQVTCINNLDLNAWVVKTDGSGNLQWSKCYGGVFSDGFYSVVQLKDSSFVFAGDTYSDDISGYHASQDAWLMRTDVNGNIIWSKALGGSLDEAFSEVQQDPFGNIVVGGYTTSFDGDLGVNYGEWDYWISIFDTAGNFICDTVYGGSQNDVCNALAITHDGGIITNGYTQSIDGDISDNYGKKDYWVVKIQGLVGIDEIAAADLQIFPNPAHEVIRISGFEKDNHGVKISIWSVNGKQVYSQLTPSGSNPELNISSLAQGMYFIEASSNKSKAIGKFVKY